MSIIITKEGNQLLRDAILNGGKVDFTQVELIADPQKSPGELNYTVNVNSVEAQGDDTVIVKALVKNDGFTETYYFNRVNIYANTERVLFAYDDGCNICIPPETIKVLNALDVYLKIESSNTELKVTYGSYVLKDEYDKLVEIVNSNTKRMTDISSMVQGTYEGTDLTIRYAEEIAEYSDPWAWIKARISAHDFSGIYIADYIPLITSDSKTLKMQVAGIDTYYGSTDKKLGHHIDFISKDCLEDKVKWNLTDSNMGTAQNPAPYMISNLYTYLTTTVYNKLPAEVKNVIVTKRMQMEHRYLLNQPDLSESNSKGFYDIGSVWVPTEYEVFGSAICGTRMYSDGLGVQYPIFANSSIHRMKGAGDNGSPCEWWLATAFGQFSSNCVYVSFRGSSSSYTTKTPMNIPICFRIME